MKKQTYPKEWYKQIYDVLNIKRGDFKNQRTRIMASKLRSIFKKGFTPNQFLSVWKKLPQNPLYWKCNLNFLLSEDLKEKQIKLYPKSEGGTKSIKEILKNV